MSCDDSLKMTLLRQADHPFEGNVTQLVSEKGSNSIGVPIPVNAKPFTNVPSNSGEFPYVRCMEWLKKRITHKVRRIHTLKKHAQNGNFKRIQFIFRKGNLCNNCVRWPFDVVLNYFYDWLQKPISNQCVFFSQIFCLLKQNNTLQN